MCDIISTFLKKGIMFSCWSCIKLTRCRSKWVNEMQRAFFFAIYWVKWNTLYLVTVLYLYYYMQQRKPGKTICTRPSKLRSLCPLFIICYFSMHLYSLCVYICTYVCTFTNMYIVAMDLVLICPHLSLLSPFNICFK